MAIILEARNPDDGIATYDKVEFHRSDTLAGSYTLQTTQTIDVSTISDLSPGFTAWIDSTGSSSKYYKIRWKNNGSGAVSSFSDIFQGETTVLDSRFRKMMRDTNSNNYFFSNDDVSEFRKDAIYSLWPSTWQETTDTSLTSNDQTEIYTLPSGVTRLNSIDLVDTDGNTVGSPTGYSIRSNKIIFPSAPTNGYTMRLWVEKMFVKSAEVPEVFDAYLLDYMMLRAYKELEADRAKAYKYVTVAKPDQGGLNSIRDIILRLESSTEKRLNRLRRVRKPSDMNMQ